MKRIITLVIFAVIFSASSGQGMNVIHSAHSIASGGSGSESTENDTIECTADALIYATSTQAYGTWEFWYYRPSGGLRVTDVSYIDDNNTSTGDAGGVRIDMNYAEDMRHVNSGVSTLFTASTGTVPENDWFKVTIERNETLNELFTGAAGASRVLVDDVLVTAASGDNPASLSAHTSSSYIIIQLDDGDIFTGFTTDDGTLNYSSWTAGSGTITDE